MVAGDDAPSVQPEELRKLSRNLVEQVWDNLCKLISDAKYIYRNTNFYQWYDWLMVPN